jgi:hypothetical protein
LATGASAFVVHDPLDTMLCRRGSYLSWFTPRTTVKSASVDLLSGAETITFFAPALRWALAFSESVKSPVDSMT